MKQKDFVIIGVVVLVAGILSFVVSSKLFSTPKDKKVQVEVVEPISANFAEPSKKFFNDTSINPTQQIQIGGDQSNQSPFNESQQ